jgi:heptosyltransferase-1
MNILIIRVSAIGDVIHTLPALSYIRKSIPDAKITWVVQKKAAALLKQPTDGFNSHPSIHRLYVLPNGFLRPKHWRNTLSVIRKLQKEKWAAIIDFQGLLKTSLIYALLSGVKFGFNKKNCRESISTLFTHYQTNPIYKNIIQKNLALASDVVEKLTKKNYCPSISTLDRTFYIPKEKQQTVERWLQQNDLTNYIIFCPNTTWETKHWPLEHWKRLLTITKHKIVLVGECFGSHGKNLANYIKEKNLSIPCAPKWDLVTTAHLIKKSKLLIAPDTGILHIADFLGTKTIGLFSPTNASTHGAFLTKDNIYNAIQIPGSMKNFSPEELHKTILCSLNK